MALTLEQVLTYVETHQNISSSGEEKEVKETIHSKPIGLHDSKPAKSFPDSMGNVFGPFAESVVRVGTPGVWVHRNNTRNISLYFTILMAIKSDFKEMSFEKQTLFIEDMILKLRTDLTKEKLFKKFNYRGMGMTRAVLMEQIKDYSNTWEVVKYLSDYFGVNIFVFDFYDKKIKAVYSENSMNYFKPTLLCVHTDNFFESVMYKGETLFTYDKNPFQHMLDFHGDSIQAVWFGNKKVNSKVFAVGESDLDTLVEELEDSDEEVVLKNQFAEEDADDNEANPDDVMLKTEAADPDELSDTDLSEDTDGDDTDTDTEDEDDVESEHLVSESSDTDDDTEEESDADEVPEPNMKMLLKDLQGYAKKLGIKLKTDKNRPKTKAVLIKEIKSALK